MLPYQLTQGVVGMFYYHVGVLLVNGKLSLLRADNRKVLRLSIFPLSLIVAGVCIIGYKRMGDSMNLSSLAFPMFPLDYLNAILLSLGLYVIVIETVKSGYVPRMQKALSWIGRGSMVIYFVHCLEYHTTIHPLSVLIDEGFADGNVGLYMLTRPINPTVQILICVLSLYIWVKVKTKRNDKLNLSKSR